MSDVADTVLTRDKIVDAAECALRRYGLAKTTVVDVARALDVSHGSVYRHFPSKASLRDAVADRWLSRACAPLCEIAQSSASAPEKVEKYLRALIFTKQQKFLEDPELFATYLALARDAQEAVRGYVERMVKQLADLIAEGVAQGTFEVADVQASARAVFDATTRFHHPAHADEWKEPGIEKRIDATIALVLRGLRPCSAVAKG
jgi:AcrR family transcriptional regulator